MLVHYALFLELNIQHEIIFGISISRRPLTVNVSVVATLKMYRMRIIFCFYLYHKLFSTVKKKRERENARKGGQFKFFIKCMDIMGNTLLKKRNGTVKSHIG